MPDFEEFVRNERQQLSERRDELRRQRDDLDRQIEEIDKEFAAVDAYERVKTGKGAAPSATSSRRRTGVRQNVLEVVKRHPRGISRADILNEMGAKGEKRDEQSISNALSNLKKQGQVRLDQGQYTPAA